MRASIAREYKIKEDLELGKGKANDKGQLRSTVAGEIAYDEIKDRLKKGDKNPISASSFDVAKMDKDSEVTSDRYFNKTRGNLEKIVEDLKYYGVGSLLNLARPFVTSKKEKEIDDKIEAARKNRKDRKESIDKEVIREEKNELDRQMEISKLKYQIFKMKDSPEKKLLENRLHNLIRESDTLEGFYKVVFSSNKNDKDIKEFLTTPKEREEYRQREINKLKYQIFNEKDPNEKIALESRMKYLIRESNQLDSFLENGKEFLHSAGKQAPEGALKGLAFSAASKVKMSGPLLFFLTSENLNSNEDAVLRDMRKKNIKDISPDEEKYIKDFPEYYENENIASRINILKTEWNKTERNNDIANYYSNKGTDISRGLGSFVGDFSGMIAGGIAGEIAISKTTNTFRGNLNTSTNINNYKEFPNKVFINDGTPGGTTIARQTILTDSSGNMIKLQDNLTTREILLQGINPSGQLIYEKSLIPTVAYNAENTSLVLYDKSKFLSVPVATNGTLVAPLTTNSTLATVPLLTDGTNKIIRKTDFYVGPDGASSTLPATAYRYLDSKAYVETKKNMTGNLSYFGFKKFDTAYQARDGFQIKYDYYNQNDPYRSWSNAAVRGTFDTLQLYDNTTGKLKVRIPYTFGDTGKDLEPFTESYPEYGQGGELQMIRLRWDEDLIIKYDRLDILPNPRTDLILKEEIIK